MFSLSENGTRTRDPDLGKVVLYQLSYFRSCAWRYFAFCDAKVRIIFESASIFAKKFNFSIKFIFSCYSEILCFTLVFMPCTYVFYCFTMRYCISLSRI